VPWLGFPFLFIVAIPDAMLRESTLMHRLFSMSTVLRGLGFFTAQEVYASGASTAYIVLAIVHNNTRNGVGPPLI
jgi:hypothetical protein